MKLLAGLTSMSFIALVVLFDAARLQKDHPSIYKARMSNTPGAWGMLTFLLSVLPLPFYLYQRHHYFLDYQGLPPEERQVPGTNSFLKTCLSAKILLNWFLCVGVIALVAPLSARALGITKDALTRTIDANLLGTVIFLIAFFILGRLAAKEYPHLGFGEIFDLKYKKISKKRFFFVPILISLLMALVVTTVMLWRKVAPPTPLGTSLAQSSSWALLAFMAFATFLAPIFEELLYRGLFFRVLLRNKGKVWAIFATSICFWAAHADRAGDVLALTLLLVFSFCVTWVRFWTRTTLTAILMHYTYNIGISLFAFLFLLITNASHLQCDYLDFFPKEQHESILLKTIEKNPKYAIAYNNLAWIYATENRNLEKALSLAEQALALEPEDPAIWDTKAEVLFKMGRIDEAMAIEAKLAKHFPADPFFKQQLQTFQKKKSSPDTARV